MAQPETDFARWLEDDEPEEEEPQAGSSRRRRLLYTGLALVLVLVLVGGGLFIRGHFLGTKAPTYQYTSVISGNVTVQVSATGPVASSAVYNLNFPGSGKLIELDVSVGQQVKAGQVLAKIDPTALNDAVNSAQASVNSAWIGYQNALLNLKDVKAANDPCPTTATPPATPKTQDQCTEAIDQAEQQVNSTWAQYESAQTQLQTAKDNAAGATMEAPAAGTVASINGSVGSTVGGSSSGSSSSSSSAFIVLEDLSQLSITAQVNEADIANVKIGQTAQFTVSAYPSDTFYGTVTSISPLGQTNSGVVTYPVTIKVDTGNLNGANLLPGMTATLEITTQERIGVLLISNRALSFARTLEANGTISASQVRSLLAGALQQAGSQAPQGTATFVVEMKNGQLTPKIIFTGLTDGTNTEVISGLQEGEQVVSGQIGGTATTTSGGSSGGGGFGGGGIFGGGGRGGGGGGFGGGGGG
jgi:multidrug efflux pump subunit AcrA (membrane-fusion protein)